MHDFVGGVILQSRPFEAGRRELERITLPSGGISLNELLKKCKVELYAVVKEEHGTENSSVYGM